MLNNVAIIGRWTKQPELKYTQAGKPVLRGTLAVQRSFTNAQGQREADFIQVTIWGKIAETVANNAEKGSRFGGSGRIQTGSFDGQDGKRIYTTEVVIENITMIDWADNGQGGQGQQSGQGGAPYQNQGGAPYQNQGGAPNQNNQNPNQNPNNQYQNNQNQNAYSDPFATGGGPIDVSDEDLPF